MRGDCKETSWVAQMGEGNGWFSGFLRKEVAECDPPIQMEPASTSGTEVSIPSLTEITHLDVSLRIL